MQKVVLQEAESPPFDSLSPGTKLSVPRLTTNESAKTTSIFLPISSVVRIVPNLIEQTTVSNLTPNFIRPRTTPGFFDLLTSAIPDYGDRAKVLTAFERSRGKLEAMGFEFMARVLLSEDPEAPGDHSTLLVLNVSNKSYDQILDAWVEVASDFADDLPQPLKGKVHLVLRTA